MKAYINMVIHDMRNPAFLIDSSLDDLAGKLGILGEVDDSRSLTGTLSQNMRINASKISGDMSRNEMTID